MIHPIIFLTTTIIITIILPTTTTATEDQCQKDCRSPHRPLSTKPWDERDALGNELSLTRPHPYSTAGIAMTLLAFNVTMRLIMPRFDPTLHVFDGNVETRLVGTVTKGVLKEMEYVGADARVVNRGEGVVIATNGEEGEESDGNYFDVMLEIEAIAEDNGYNHTTINEFFDDISKSVYREASNAAGRFTTFFNEISPSHIERLAETQLIAPTTTNPSTYRVATILSTPLRPHNPYAPFCELGCTYFFTSVHHARVPRRNTLDTCTTECDETYRYEMTVGYNDLAELARLECRDGCQLALMRCQPGYYCTQVVVRRHDDDDDDDDGNNIDENLPYKGGMMRVCPPGTYRDVSYDAVTECLPCPPGRYREDVKGWGLESCTKCPVGTYAAGEGSDSVRDCLRCPAGMFNEEMGAGECHCITEGSCAGVEEEFEDPADREKRETVPFIGRW